MAVEENGMLEILHAHVNLDDETINLDLESSKQQIAFALTKIELSA